MRYSLFVILLLLVMPVRAQNCGNGLPCGNVPWTLPQFPNLNSPTPANYTNSNTVIYITSTPVPTSTAYITPTPFFDTSSISDNVSTIEAIFNATDIPITNELGTPIALESSIVDNGSIFFSYARGFTSNSFGVFAPMIDFMLFTFLLSLTLAVIRLTLPLFGVLIGILRKIIQLILDFIPL